jgi:hypothetical protein
LVEVFWLMSFEFCSSLTTLGNLGFSGLSMTREDLAL